MYVEGSEKRMSDGRGDVKEGQCADKRSKGTFGGGEHGVRGFQ